MSRQQVAEAQRVSRDWKPQSDRSEKPSQESVGSGSGFVVAGEGYVVTNSHVVSGCSSVQTQLNRRMHKLNLVAQDRTNDLAVLKLVLPATSTVSAALFSFDRRPKLGQTVLAAGYPLPGLLTSSLNVTTGTVSALAGIQNDWRMVQITALVQPGNSGGPLLDEGGNVLGVIRSKLDALGVAELTGDIPQNVNFAIRGSLLMSFLDSHGIRYGVASQPRRLPVTAIADLAKAFTLLVECR